MVVHRDPSQEEAVCSWLQKLQLQHIYLRLSHTFSRIEFLWTKLTL